MKLGETYFSTLGNGLKLLIAPMTGTEIVSTAVVVGSGSRNETREINGIAHFLEHLFFKGGKRFKRSRDVSEAIESKGCTFNAYTGSDEVAYCAFGEGRHVEVLVDVFSDMMINAAMPSEEIERERGTIVEEINMYQDRPMEQILFDFGELIFGNQPIGFSQLGTLENVKRFCREDFINYRNKLYTPDNAIVCIAGKINNLDYVEGLVRHFFSEWCGASGRTTAPFDSNIHTDKVFIRHKKTAQAHIVLGTPAYPYKHKDAYVAEVFNKMFGGGMSSTLWDKIRDKQGLVYYISSGVQTYTDAGLFYIRAGINLDKLNDALDTIIKECKAVAQNGISGEELRKGKDMMRGGLILNLENPIKLSIVLGIDKLFYDEITTPEEIIEKIEAVTLEDVQRVAQDIFKPERFRLALICPKNDVGLFEQIISQ